MVGAFLFEAWLPARWTDAQLLAALLSTWMGNPTMKPAGVLDTLLSNTAKEDAANNFAKRHYTVASLAGGYDNSDARKYLPAFCALCDHCRLHYFEGCRVILQQLWRVHKIFGLLGGDVVSASHRLVSWPGAISAWLWRT